MNLVEPNERVLSTLNQDGSRFWIRPRVSPGRFLTRRRIVAYALIAIFTLIPYIQLNGKPLILLDIIHREFTFFGKTFLPTDTLLLALFMVGLFMTIFLVTALFGRVWCGWACPQTVYMEFLYRPIERLFEGSPGRKQKVKGAKGVRRAAKYVAYLICSLFLAHTFIAYFVGVEQLRHWIFGNPADHPVAFIVMAAVTFLMMFDFAFFREQVCLVACPYGRFQSALLDRKSLIVMYDRIRGEPRGKKRKTRNNDGDVSLDVLGDCIDCKMCVTTCPTGIDIRNGLQMECIGCAQCIDACDSVMKKIGRDPGLIRYGTQAAAEGEPGRILRARLIIYPTILAIVATLFVVVLLGKADTDVRLLPRSGSRPYFVLDSGEVSNPMNVRLVNRNDEPATYTFTALEPAVSRLDMLANPITLEPGEMVDLDLNVISPADIFARGPQKLQLEIRDDGEFSTIVDYTMLGPRGRATPATNDSDTDAPDGAERNEQ